MAIGAYEEAYQRVLRHAAELKAAVEALQAKYEEGILELMAPVSEEDVTPEAGLFLLAMFGENWRNRVFHFEDGVEFQAYPVQHGTRDAEVIAIMGQSDVTGMRWMSYNNGNAAWNARETLAAQAENSAAKAVSFDAYTELRKQRLRDYRGGFRYPPTVENGWEQWEINELDKDHLASLGF